MNPVVYTQKKPSIMPIVSHIKVPSFEMNSQGKEILKAKKLTVNPPQTKSRSLSAHSNFRSIFKIPRNKKEVSKENAYVFNKASNDKLQQDPNSSASAENKTQNFTEIHYLNEICQQMTHEHNLLKKKLEDQEKILSNYSYNKCVPIKAKVPKINLTGHKISPLRAVERTEVKTEELITFRPVDTPSKKQFRFPREIFSKKLNH